MKSQPTMKLIMTTYPGFHDLPKGVRKMLLVSESFFFDEMRRQTERPVELNAVLVSPPVMVSGRAAAMYQNVSSDT
jgi:hypothetical protein